MYHLLNFLRTLPGRITLAILLLILLIWTAPRFSSSWQLNHRNQLLFDACETPKWKTVESLLHPDYSDQWNFNRDQALLALKDARTPFLLVSIKWIEANRSTSKPLATITGTVEIEGSGSALASYVKTEVNRVSTPFILHWEKTSWTPWSWKLKRIENEALNVPPDYQPGMIHKRLKGL